MRFADRTVVVTGAARGIGRGIVTGFLREGARVFATDVAEIPLAGGLVVHRADLAVVADVEGIVPAALAAFGRVDVLVNNAAVQPDGPALGLDAAGFDVCFAVNVRAPLLLMRDVARRWVERVQPGVIVNVVSANAFQNESPESVYNASKAALAALTRAFAHELGHHGIRVNAVAPGETMTPEGVAAGDADKRARAHRYLRRVPLRRVGTVEDQARAVLFLASDEASFITAQTLVVDGGETGGGRWYDERDEPPLPPLDGDWYPRK